MPNPNRLIHEQSLYLRQHAHNAVDWFPWGEEALQKAKSENKPILLSVGYSACHWCHVMEKESFENPEIARLMNASFINVKVDREERPDLDQIYQNVAQLYTQSGGWPLTVFLTPDLKPFFGGTYFPPEDRYGRPGFPRVLQALAQAYQHDFGQVQENAERMSQAIHNLETTPIQEKKSIRGEDLKKFFDQMLNNIDWRFGGFGSAPKFPQPMALQYLWRYSLLKDIGMGQEAVLISLTEMARGGIFDHLRGGFHRYSVDQRWSVPHFEKMLYDNALLIKLYSEVLLSAPALPEETQHLFLSTIEKTVDYLFAEMQSPLGLFHATQDADSQGVEGKYFIWNEASIREALGNDAELTAFAVEYFGVTPQGNFEETGQTVLHKSLPFEREHAEKISLIEQKLLKARESRIKPNTDEKIILSWNGLLIEGLCWAGKALKAHGKEDIGGAALNAARENFDWIAEQYPEFLPSVLYVQTAAEPLPKGQGFLEDYAYLIRAAIELSRTDLKKNKYYLDQAIKWSRQAIVRFHDDVHFGFYSTSAGQTDLLQRPKNLYDQAIPSANAVMMENLWALSQLTDQTELAQLAENDLACSISYIEHSPLGMASLVNNAFLFSCGALTCNAEESSLYALAFLFFKPTEETPSAPEDQLQLCHAQSCHLVESSDNPTENKRKILEFYKKHTPLKE